MLPEIRLDPFVLSIEGFAWVINPFKAIIALGLLFALLQILLRARRVGLRVRTMLICSIWVFSFGYIGAVILSQALYFPESLLEPDSWRKIFQLKAGMSSFGGLMSGVLAYWIFIYLHDLQEKRKAVLDTLVQGAVVGFIFGRLGCTFAHDHLGGSTDFFLAVSYAEGLRHNVGFYEFLYLLLLVYPVSLWIDAKKRQSGAQVVACSLTYGVGRFALDWLRVDDARYLGLTPAQYCCLVLLAIGIAGLQERSEHVAGDSLSTVA